jgi:hypothetical protein
VVGIDNLLIDEFRRFQPALALGSNLALLLHCSKCYAGIAPMRAFHETPENAAECLILAQSDAGSRPNDSVFEFSAEQVAV